MKTKSFGGLNSEVQLPSLAIEPAKQQVLRAACLLLLDLGLEKPVNMSQLAKRSGMSIQRLRYHYKSLKEILPDLLMSIFVSGREVTMRALAQDPPTHPLEIIHCMVKGLFLWVDEYPHLSRLSSVFSALTDKDSEIGAMYSQQWQQGL
jgi:AcrR family transcriptional regulator